MQLRAFQIQHNQYYVANLGVRKGVTKQVKSKQRVADHGEVFTAEREVKAMCDLVAQECDRIDSRSCRNSYKKTGNRKKTL